MKKVFLLLLFFNSSYSQTDFKPVEKREAITTQINDYLELRSKVASYRGAVLVARNDSILFSKGFGLANTQKNTANNKNTKFKIGSISKTFTALAILQLCEKGKIKLEDNISMYLTNFPNGEKIKIRNLLNHSSGLPEKWRSDWHEKRRLSFDAIIQKIATKELLFAPGTKAEYSNCGYAILTAIIEKVSGINYEDYCRLNIFSPAKMMDTGAVFYPEKDYDNFATGYEYAAGIDGLNTNLPAEFIYTPNLKGQAAAFSTVEDLYRFDQALKKNLLLGKKYSKLLIIKLSNSDFTLGNWLSAETKSNGTLYYFSGVSNGFESVMYRYLDKNITIIALNNHQNTDVFITGRTLIAILDGKDIYMPEPRSEQIFRLEENEDLKGIYFHNEDERDQFEIIIEGNRIFVYSNNDPWEELFLFGPRQFFSKNYDLHLDFRNSNKCIWTYNGQSSNYIKQ